MAGAAQELASARGGAQAQEAADEGAERAAQLASEHDGALGGVAPLSALAAIGAAARVAGSAHHPASYPVWSPAPADLHERLREVCAAVTGPARDWVRLAVADVVDDAGRPWRLIGTTELDGYLRPGIALREGELSAGNDDWPELSIATFCAARGFAPGPVLGAVEPPEEVCDRLRAWGFHPEWSERASAPAYEEGDDAPAG